MTMIAAAVAVLYLLHAVITHNNGKIPQSISETSYLTLAHKGLFSAIMGVESALLLPTLLDKSAENTQFLGFLSIIGLLMVAASPYYKTENRLMHYLGGIVAGIGSQLLIALNNPIILSSWALFPLTLLNNKGKNSVFWAEIICLLNIICYCI